LSSSSPLLPSPFSLPYSPPPPAPPPPVPATAEEDEDEEGGATSAFVAPTKGEDAVKELSSARKRWNARRSSSSDFTDRKVALGLVPRGRVVVEVRREEGGEEAGCCCWCWERGGEEGGGRKERMEDEDEDDDDAGGLVPVGRVEEEEEEEEEDTPRERLEKSWSGGALRQRVASRAAASPPVPS